MVLLRLSYGTVEVIIRLSYCTILYIVIHDLFLGYSIRRKYVLHKFNLK